MRKNITLYRLDSTGRNPDESYSIELPEGYRFTLGDTETGESVQMADGSIVFEQSALRRTLDIECGYLPKNVYIGLLTLRRMSPFVFAIYPDVDGGDVSGVYQMEIGNRQLFMFRGDEPVFKGVTISLTAREVG